MLRPWIGSPRPRRAHGGRRRALPHRRAPRSLHRARGALEPRPPYVSTAYPRFLPPSIRHRQVAAPRPSAPLRPPLRFAIHPDEDTSRREAAREDLPVVLAPTKGH